MTNKKGGAREDDEDLSKITTPNDEFQHWLSLSEQYQLKPEQLNRAQAISDQFKDIKPGFADLSAKTPLSELVELIELTQDALDSIWRLSVSPPYPEGRMKHLLHVVSNAFVNCIVPLLVTIQPWADDLNDGVKDQLNGILGVCTRWTTCTYTLTYNFWPNYEGHKWNGKPFLDDSFADLTQRIQDVLTIRTVYDQMVSNRLSDERPPASPFSAFNPQTTFTFNENNDAEWRIAVREYDSIIRAVSGIEQRASQKVRKQLGSLASQPTQLLAEFMRFKDLVRRPNIAKELGQEREVLLGQLTTYINGLRDEFDSRTRNFGSGNGSAQQSQGRNLPEVVNAIVWVRQLINKVESTTATVEQLLGELPRVKSFTATATELLSEMRSYQNDQFASWGQETTDALRDADQPVALQMSGRIMDIDFSDGSLKVNYSERLVTLLREVRQLMTLGFKIPAKIREAADVAQKFYRYLNIQSQKKKQKKRKEKR